MPRNNDVYSPPSGTGGTPQTPISSTMFNAYVADITEDLNNARPIVAGGTGATTAQGAIDNFFAAARTIKDDKLTIVDPSDATKIVRLDAGNVTAGETWPLFAGKGSDVASAGTVTLGAGNFFHITGTTTITDIDFTDAYNGRWAILEFDGALTLTHNATTLVIPGGASITTAASDTCMVVQDASDNVHVAWYQRRGASPLPSNGSAGQTPRMNSAATGLVMQTDWETIGRYTGSNALGQDINNLSAYRKIRIEGWIYPANSSGVLWLRTSTDNGANYDSGSNNYSTQHHYTSGSTPAATDMVDASAILLTPGQISNDPNHACVLDVQLEQFNQSSHMRGVARFAYYSGSNFILGQGSIRRGSTTARDALRLVMSTGNMYFDLLVRGLRG